MSAPLEIIPQIIPGLGAIAARFDALLVDVWGVIHNGRTPFADAIEACRRFRVERGPAVLISNSPRPSGEIPGQFASIGVPNDFYDAIVTSGDATRAALGARVPGPAFRIGPDRDERLYEGLGLDFADIEHAAFISCTGPRHDDRETPEDYADIFAIARARDLEMVCANPDIVVQRGDQIIYCAGALAEAYEEMGGRVVMCGKPFAPIYELALARIAEAAGAAAPTARILAVGDGLDTDLAGAEGQGLLSLFIAGGIHGADVIAGGALDGGRLGALLAAKGRRADYAAPALAW